MRLKWCDIEGFPGYHVCENGEVFNSYSGVLLTHSMVQNGIPSVAMVQGGTGSKQYRRSVPLLVAKAFLPNPPRYDFNTPIHLNGDRSNCRADNLMWRPRWFAIQYHQERRQEPFSKWTRPFEVIETGEMFDHPRDCAVRYGLLEDGEFGILHAITNKNAIFPTNFSFRW